MIKQITVCHHSHRALIAKATITAPPKSKKNLHHAQKLAVRQLLHYCQTQFYSDYTFFEQIYPYHLSKNINGDNGINRYFVSFSHSQDTVALIISPNVCGIDVEHAFISNQIAKRFFHPNELQALIQHKTPNQARKKLWQIKECFAKLNNTTLSCTITQDYHLFLSAIDQSQQNSGNHQYHQYGTHQYYWYNDDEIFALSAYNPIRSMSILFIKNHQTNLNQPTLITDI